MALHAALASEGRSLKDWFSHMAHAFVSEQRQPRLNFNSPATQISAPGEPAQRT